jgi:uncharacterized membrane protein YedE/YeeE
MIPAAAFVIGLVFAAGLVIAGMTTPAKVIGFLDVGGAWDGSLAFVMVGAIAVFLPVFRLSRRRARPLLADRFDSPVPAPIDARLLGGAALFGVGWGLGGYCPGPALASLLGGGLSALVFVAAMMLGIVVARSRWIAPR